MNKQQPFQKVDQDNPVPRYIQIKNNIHKLIQTGTLEPNEVLPAENQLAEAYGVNRLTVRHAITELVNEGLVVRKHGVGTFIAEPKITTSHQRLLSFTQRMTELGYNARSELIEAERLLADYETAAHLEVEEGTAIFQIIRLRLADEQPLMVETVFIPEAICPDLLTKNLTQSLYNILTADFGIVPAEADQFLEPILTREWEADMLDTRPGSPAMLVETTMRDDNGRIVEFSKGVMRGDNTRIYFHVSADNIG